MHSLHNNIGTYIREAGEVPTYASRQFFLLYHKGDWLITGDKENDCLWGGNKSRGHLLISTKGNNKIRLVNAILRVLSETNPIKLGTEWKEADGKDTWSRKATVKIFNDEEEYKNYQSE